MHPADVAVLDRDGFHLGDGARAALVRRLLTDGVPLVLADPLTAGQRALLTVEEATAAAVLQTVDLPDDEVVERAVAAGMRAAVRRATPMPDTSILVATRRPANLAALLETLARQVGAAGRTPQVLIALHGPAFPADVADQIRRRLPGALVVACDARQPFGSVLQALTDRADGQVLTKMDDDDLYADHHVDEVARLLVNRGVQVTGRAAEFVYLRGPDITVRRRFGVTVGPADSVAGGTLTVSRSAVREAGGWPAVRRAVDRALLDRLAVRGAVVFRASPVGYLLVRHGDHTWTAPDQQFLEDSVRQWRGCATTPAGVSDPRRVDPQGVSDL